MHPDLIEITQTEKLICSNQIVQAHYTQKQVHTMLHAVADALPQGMRLVVFEAYRPKSRQVMLWNRTYAKVQGMYPQADEAELTERTAVWTANPFTTGSGHQAGAAVDVSIEHNGTLLDMGTDMHEFNAVTKTDSFGLADTQQKNRAFLLNHMHAVGLINYPDEWWHYSYGDRLWALICNKPASDIVFQPYMDG